MNRLRDSTVLVTGASSGIGQAICKRLLDEGANVLGVTRRPSALDPDISPIEADLAKREDVSGVFRDLGKIDALVNCAGVAYLSRIIDGNPADWEEMWRVNVMALSLCCQLSLRHFPADGGRIVNISSMSGHRVPPTGGFYAPTKFAVKAVSDALRLELKAAGLPVQVSCVSPGFVNTPLLEQYFLGREEALAKTREAMKMLEPDDIAQAVMSILQSPPHVEIGDILMRSGEQRM